MILYLIRHGKSYANISKLVTGNINDELCDQGIHESKKLAAWLTNSNIAGDYYFTSQWKRAQQTAKYLWPHVKWDIDSRVGETDAGIVSNWPLDQFLSEYPDFYNNSKTKYPRGESHSDLNIRVLSWLQDMFEIVPQSSKLVLVSHSGPISCILQYVMGLSMKNFPEYLALNSSISIVDFPNNNIELAKLLGFSICAKSNTLDDYLNEVAVD